MTEQAIKFKKERKDLSFKNMSLSELLKLPPHNGILNFKISETSFLILNILNDDSSAVKFFWKDSHDTVSLDLWYKISKKKGLYIDVGAHTGLYSITSLKANPENKILCFEPYFMNLSRLNTNLRLNGLAKNVSGILAAISNYDGKSKFKITTEKTYMSKGGKIGNEGLDINVHKLDTLYFNNLNEKINAIKIDTEGEDLNVLLGAEKLINKDRPQIIIEVREENKFKISKFLRNYSYKLYDVIDLEKEIDLANYKISNVINLYAKYEK